MWSLLLVVIGSYFCVNDEDETVTVNGERYMGMTSSKCFWNEIENIDVNVMRFQLNGSACHKSLKTLDVLGEND